MKRLKYLLIGALLLLVACKAEGQNRTSDTSFTITRYDLAVYGNGKGGLIASLNENGEWTIVDTMATIKQLYKSFKEESEIARYKADLYYALIDVVNAAPMKHPSKRYKDALKKFFELRNRQIKQ